MASNRAPKHDFAPAWLKIPDSDSHKSSGPKQSEHGDRPGWGRPPSRGPPPRGPPLPHEDFYGDRRGYPPPSKNRHHALDDDYYNYYGYYGNGYSGWGGNGNFRSQPSHNGRDCPPPGKYGGGPRYPPPPGPPMNGFRPPPPHPPPPPMGNGGYYDPYGGYGGGKDYYEPPYYSHHPNNRPPSAAGRRLYDNRSNSTGSNSRVEKENKQVAAADSKKKKEPNLEDEFPSLIEGDSATPEVKTAKTLNSSGVWEKSPISKIKSPNYNSSRANTIDNPRESVKHNTSNIYKALIPNKANLSKKGSLSKDRDVNSNTSHFSKVNKESRIMSPSVDMLTRTKTQPKKLPDKKSDFLKQLKKEKPITNGDLKSSDKEHPDDEEHIVNGVSELSVDLTVAQQNGQDEEERSRHSSNSSNIFSASSLEAEQRLLKEMGWTEDEEEYIITEDEKKEMQQNIQRLKEQQQGRNGLVHGATRCFSSPQHHGVPIFHTPPPLNDDDLTSSSSSSSSSSDEDEDDHKHGGGGDSGGGS